MLRSERTLGKNVNISLAETDEQILATYGVMRQLRPNVPESQYVELVRLQQREVAFQLAALRNGDQVTCVAGFRYCRSLGWGKFLYVDDLVTDERYRSKGAGKAMFDWLVERARENHCDELRLDSAVYRHGAHRFYIRAGMDIVCFHFRLALDATPRNDSEAS
jgi:GNAT superfamily N-acetyltransferase